MTNEEREEFWNQTVTAAKNWDVRFLRAIIAALALRFGDMRTCAAGCHTFPVLKVTLEELDHILNNYNCGVQAPEKGTVELTAIAREYLGERHSDFHKPA